MTILLQDLAFQDLFLNSPEHSKDTSKVPDKNTFDTKKRGKNKENIYVDAMTAYNLSGDDQVYERL